MFEVTQHDQVTRIRSARSLLGARLHEVSCYLVGDTLVDSGCPATAHRLAAWCGPRGVRRVVHTHHHEDHTGGDAVLVRRLGVEVLAPPRTVPILEDFYRLPWYRGLVWGRARSAPARPFGGHVRVGDHRAVVIPTPGHSADHVCLFLPERGWIFTGDLFISRRVRYLRAVEDAGRILDSLRRIRSLEPCRLICSHAGVVEPATTALDERIGFWEQLRAEAARRMDAGESESIVSRQLLGREGLITLLSMGDFAKRNLIRSLAEGGGSDPS